jgi:hypothetical protein
MAAAVSYINKKQKMAVGERLFSRYSIFERYHARLFKKTEQHSN